MNILVPRRCFVQCLGLVLGLSMLVSGASGQRAALAMRAAALPSGAADTGPLPGSQSLSLTLYLQPSADRQAALETFLQDLQTPGSAAYHAWMTPQQFGAAFGVAPGRIATVRAYALSAGLTVESTSVSGLRMVVSGTVAQVEAAFAPSLHGIRLAQQMYFANTAPASLPAELAPDIASIAGLSDLPDAQPMSVRADGAATVTATDGLAAIAALLETNTARVLSLSTSACLEDVDLSTRAALTLALQQAGAQGVTVLASTGCNTRGSAGFPSILAEATSVATAPGITPPAFANLTGLRPSWQSANGLPADGLRHEPDLTVSSLSALTQTVLSILAEEPAAADGAPARLGNINPTLYQLAVEPGLYTQPDHAAPGAWEPATGLGAVDLNLLGKFFPRGSLSVNVSINVSNGGYVTHGQSLTFSSTVTDTSGKGNGVVPSGTITFTTNTGVTLGTATLSSGSASVTYNQLPGGTYTVQAAYSGDGTYASNTSISTGFTVGPEAAQITASAGSGSVGGTLNITVTVKSTSGVGTPSGTVTVIPQGTSDTNTYSGTLSGSGGTAIATVAVAAVQGGADVFKVNCTTSASFTCYNPQNVNAQVNLGTPTLTLTANPTAPTNGQTDTLTAVVAGKGGVYPTPTGNMNFYDNGTQLGSATLSSGSASFTTKALTGSSHSFSATYGGDNNYNTVTATSGATNSAVSATTLLLSILPNPPVSGSTTTITASIAYTLTNSVAPTGTVNFFEDGSLLASEPINNVGQAVYSSTTLSSATSHQFYAVYNGDTNYQSSTSATFTTAASSSTSAIATTTALTVSPNPPVGGSTTTLTATVSHATGSAAPTGTVTFYEDSVALGTVSVSASAASYTSTTLTTTSTHTFTATYNGDTNYAASTSPAVTATPATAGTYTSYTTLTVSPDPPVSGNTTTLLATVIGSYGGGTPTGTVAFYEDGVSIGSSPLVNQGSASNTFMVATLTSSTITGAAAHSFYAVYAGSTSYAASTSTAVATTASGSLLPTTLTLALSPNPVVSGSTATLTATIATTGTVTPTGTITLYYDDPPGGLPLNVVTVTGKTVTLASGTGSTFQQNVYNAVYSGDSNYTGSTSQNLSASSTQASTTISAAVASTSVTAGGTDVLTATLSPSSTVNGTAPTGTVTFSSSQGTLCSGSISGTTFSCTATLTATGTQTITASYSGDTNYLASTSTNAPTVTVAASSSTGTGALTVSATPNTNVMYGNTVTLSSTLSSTVSGGPSGSVTFSLAGTTTTSYTAALVSNGSSAATATYAIPTPAPGSYIITATCTSSNVTCTTLSATASLLVIKGNTTTTLVASPTSPQAGQSTLFTATVASASSTVNAAAIAPTGTVTFYINGVATPEPLNNGVATFSTVLTATTGNYVTAVYSGDTNWNGSTSSQIIVNIAPIPTTGTLTSSQGVALYTANVILTDNVLVAATTTTPYPAAPTGTVTFYDLYNGQTTLLGTTGLTQIVPGDSVAQLTTTGLRVGTHTITALFNANTAYASSTSTIVINITDYAVTFSPPSLTLAPGSGGAAITTITPENGFSGQVVLGCVPPAGAGMTCSFSPAVLTGGGTAVLSITTTAAAAKLTRPAMGRGATAISLAAVSFGSLLVAFLLPRRRKLSVLLLALLAAALAGGSMGCTTQGILTTQTGTGGGSGSGTPLGTQLLSITTQGTDGVTTVRHDSQFQVTIQ